MMPRELAPHVAFDLMQQNEVVLVDLRSPADFAQAHPQGAINLPFSSKRLAERLAMVLPADSQIILIADDEASLTSVSAQLEESTFDVIGCIENGFSAWEASSLPTRSLDEILSTKLPVENIFVLDVREPIEWEMGHVPGATLIALGDLRNQLNLLPRKGKIAIICESGIRSCIAASILLREGFTDVANVPDGTHGYRNTPDLPLEYWKEEASI